MDHYIDLVVDLFTNPRHSRRVSLGLVAFEAIFGALIIWRIPYTEIDWETYMQQVQLFLDGERDYTLIKGNTGSLVYPAIHLYVYTGLHFLTNKGTNILLAQSIFHLIYLVSLAFVLSCYRRVGAPPWLLVPLTLSKRLHSIFLLRLFNDAWANLGLWIAIYCFQRRQWLFGAFAWCFGLGVKMVLLLVAPAVGAVLLQGAGTNDGVLIGMVLPQLQVRPDKPSYFGRLLICTIQLASAFPFMSQGKAVKYLTSAFDFGRRFVFKWTVNWRFVGAEIFSLNSFAYSLLAAHLFLVLFFLHTRWVRPSSFGVFDSIQRYTRRLNKRAEELISQRVTPVFVMDAMLGSMAAGLLCARSLHYQFYAYVGWSTPYLMWRSGLGPAWVLVNWGMQELAWLTYPSTSLSSAVVVLQLLNAVVSVWWGSRKQSPSPFAASHTLEKEHGE